MKIVEIVKDAIAPVFDNLEVELLDVEYLKKPDGMHLTVYIDADRSITLDDCEMVSKLINPIIDELEPTGNDSYYLDVSSYGLDKPLKTNKQLNKYLDKMVVVSLYSKIGDKKKFEAILKNFDSDKIIIEFENENMEIEKNKIANITPFIKF